MAVAKAIEINAASSKSFEDAPQESRAGGTVRDVRGAWVKKQQVIVSNGKIDEYRVDLKVSFVLE